MINPHDDPAIIVTLTGRPEAIKSVSCTESNGTVTLTGISSGKSSSVTSIGTGFKQTIVNRGGTIEGVRQQIGGNVYTQNTGFMGPNMSISNNQVSFNGGSGMSLTMSDTDEVSIEVKVPIGCGITVLKGEGDVTIGDTKGNLTIDRGGDSDIVAGKVEQLKATLRDDVGVQVTAVSSRIETVQRDDSELFISSGNPITLTVTTRDDASFSFRGSAVNGSFEARDDSSIKVGPVANVIRMERRDDATIKIDAYAK